MKAIRHQLDVYDTMLTLAYDKPTWKAATTKGSPHNLGKMPGSSGAVYETMWVPDKGQPGASVQHLLIWIHLARHGDDVGELVASVAHEAVHAAQGILESKDDRTLLVKLNEPFAYLVDWITRWVWDNLPHA